MMQDDDNSSARPFAVGLLIGALLGAGVALLFAPQSGSDTRRLIKRRARRLANGAKDKYEDVKDRIRDARRKAEEAFSD
ncbi:MAG TPA: YtxH domain-containing protein [Gemmatimonadales bacterium]|jgi:gas vesicle protein